MVYSAEELNDNEEIVLNLRPHWWFFAKQFLVLVITLVFALVILALQLDASLTVVCMIPFLLAFVWFLARYFVWSTTRFVVTTDRLIDRSGVFKRQGIEIPLERVNTVFFSQTLFERVIGSGDLEIESAGEQGRQKFSDVRKPLNIQNEIYRQMEDNENRKFDRVGKNVDDGRSSGVPVGSDTAKISLGDAASAGNSSSIPDQIEQLGTLREKGILTQEEFTRKKNQLLDRM